MDFLPGDTIFNLSVLALLLLILLAFVALLISIHNFLSKWIGLLHQDSFSNVEHDKAGAHSQATKLLDEARQKSLAIVSDSVNKAKEALGSIKELSDESRDALESELAKALEGVSENVEKSLLEETGEFRKTLEKETIETQQEVERRIKQEYDKVAGEIKEYRAAQLKKVDETIYDVLQDVASSTLGKSINLEDHQELILNSLEEAKKAHLFSEGQSE